MGLNTSIHACNTRFYHLSNTSHYQYFCDCQYFQMRQLSNKQAKSAESAWSNPEMIESAQVFSSGRCMDAAYKTMQDAYCPDDDEAALDRDVH